jgi:hypothetical protein
MAHVRDDDPMEYLYNNSPQVGGIVSTKQEGGVLIDMLLLQPRFGHKWMPQTHKIRLGSIQHQHTKGVVQK